MFENFKSVSRKSIEVPANVYELIINHASTSNSKVSRSDVIVTFEFN